jgi:murein DD-endopeptidase MepM/ murein hydrolase activator NlpD
LPLRALITAHLVRRVLTHVVVIALVAVTSAVGIAATRPTGGISIDLVSSALGAAGAATAPRTAKFDLVPQPLEPDTLVSREGFPRFVAGPEPLPTPVPPPPAAPDPQPMTGGSPSGPVIKPKPVQGNGLLLWPVPGGTISQYYHSGHLALDIAAHSGARVVAAEAGTVTSAGWRNNGGGMVVSVRHANGVITSYNHLGTILVARGQAVARGEAIGRVGCTGVCTGPHVHFQVVVGGVIVNPLRYL